MPTVRRSSSSSSVFTGPAYAVALLFVLLPIVDTFSQTWPVNFSSPGWRYGTIGIGANYLISVLFGLLAVAVLASLGASRRVLRTIAVLCGLATVVLLVGVIGFLLDALQVRAGIPASDERTRDLFALGVAKAALKYVLGAAVTAWIALVAWRRAGALHRGETGKAEPALVKGTAEAEPGA